METLETPLDPPLHYTLVGRVCRGNIMLLEPKHVSWELASYNHIVMSNYDCCSLATFGTIML